MRTLAEYRSHREVMKKIYSDRRAFESGLAPAGKQHFTYSGFSYPAGRSVDFAVDFQYSDGQSINWRERLVCPLTGLSNRLRASIHLADSELGMLTHEAVYITEQVTPLYKFLKNRHPNLTGSEFLGSRLPRGRSDRKGVRNEDLTCLTFPDSSFDVVLSFECLEHIPDFSTGVGEMARVLKPGGRLMWSVPFAAGQEQNLRRASIGADGNIVHHEPPEYHGDPNSSDGCLCFTHFGWEMLEQVRAAGFAEAYALTYWSDAFAYLGVEQIVFVAFK